MAYRVSKDGERDLTEGFVYWATRAGVEVAERLIDTIAERFYFSTLMDKLGHSARLIALGVLFLGGGGRWNVSGSNC
jgi:plasmid stabilization system protein ParE